VSRASAHRELGQATIELGGLLVLVAVLAGVLVSLGIPAKVGHAVECSIDEILYHHGCSSASASNPYQAVCRVSSSTNSAQLEVKVAFIRVSDNDTLVKVTYSNGSSSYILTHAGTAQAEAKIGAELEAAGQGFNIGASAGIGPQLAGAQEWDFATPQQASAFDKQVQGHGGINTIAHDIVGGVLPLGLNDAAGWLLDQAGVHDDSGLPTPTATYVKGAMVGGVKFGADGGIGGLSGAIDASLQAAEGARLTTSGPNKGQVQVYLQLDGNATASLTPELFGPGTTGAGGVGQAMATVSVGADGKPQNITITVWGGYANALGASGKVQGSAAQAIAAELGKASIKGFTGNGGGLQWSGTIDLTQHPEDMNDVLRVLQGGVEGVTYSPAAGAETAAQAIQSLVGDFNRDGTQQVQPFNLSRSVGSAGVEGDVGLGVGADGNVTSMDQTYSPGVVKPPGMAWGPAVCAP
jgi:hypothetical protein